MNATVRYHLLIAVAGTVALAAIPVRAPATVAHAALASVTRGCIAHRPGPGVYYPPGCTGHDEPELDPVSNAPGSAQDLTWTLVLPADATTHAGMVGPAIWTGANVKDPKSVYGQAFQELQIYPNSLVYACGADGSLGVQHDAGVYTACSPVFADYNGAEVVVFNAMLRDGGGSGPLVMHSGDTITVHQHVTSAHDGLHVTVTDVGTGHSGTVIVNSATDGPLMPTYSVQKIGNNLKWGSVYDTPNSLVWEIGHSSLYATPPLQVCYPGQMSGPPCYSYNIPTWLGFTPLQIKGVTFADGSSAQQWATVSVQGGEAEIKRYCATYGTPFCWYPWYAYNSTLRSYTYGADYAGTSNDFGRALQFAQTTRCPGPLGPNTTYCDTILR